MGFFKTFWEGLGATPQKRTRNLITILMAIGIVTAVTMNLSFGYNTPIPGQACTCKCSGWWINWGPAAKVNATVEWKKGG